MNEIALSRNLHTFSSMPNRMSSIKGVALLYLPLMYIAIGIMTGVYGSGLPYKDWLRLLISFIGVFMLIKRHDILLHNRVLRTLVLMMGVILLPTFYFNFVVNPARAESVRNIGDSILWISVIVLAYLIAYKNNDVLYHSRWIALTIPLYFLIFEHVRAYLLLSSDDTALISTAYYSLCLIPFAFLIKRQWLMWILIGFSFLTILLSSKRAGFLAFTGAIIIYAFFKFKLNKCNLGGKLKTFLSFTVVALIGFIVFNSFVAQNELSLLERLSNLQEDGGSGRDEIYKYTFNLLCNSDIISLVFGHGFNSVISYSELGFSAHTDFIEVPFDYGIIGILIYILFYLHLFRYYRILKELDSNYAAIFMSSLFITFILSAFAHLIIYPTHFLFLCMFWGFAMGECDKNTTALSFKVK